MLVRVQSRAPSSTPPSLRDSEASCVQGLRDGEGRAPIQAASRPIAAAAAPVTTSRVSEAATSRVRAVEGRGIRTAWWEPCDSPRDGFASSLQQCQTSSDRRARQSPRTSRLRSRPPIPSAPHRGVGSTDCRTTRHRQTTQRPPSEEDGRCQSLPSVGSLTDHHGLARHHRAAALEADHVDARGE